MEDILLGFFALGQQALGAFLFSPSGLFPNDDIPPATSLVVNDDTSLAATLTNDSKIPGVATTLTNNDDA